MTYRSRFEDMGLGRALKWWPILVCIFTAGAWYQSSRANAVMEDKLQGQAVDHEHRITKVEDAVTYLAQIVRDDRARRP